MLSNENNTAAAVAVVASQPMLCDAALQPIFVPPSASHGCQCKKHGVFREELNVIEELIEDDLCECREE